MGYDVERVKRELDSYREGDIEIDTQIERLERLVAKMDGLHSAEISDMPKSPSPDHDKISGLLDKKTQLEAEIRKMVQHQSDVRNRYEEVLKMLPRARERAIIRSRYFDGEQWSNVTKLVYGQREDYEERYDSYARRIFECHGNALTNIAKSLSEL